MKTVNVDRMRRYRYRTRPRYVWSKDELRDVLRAWAATTDPSDHAPPLNGLLHWVKGPWPNDTLEPIELFPAEQRELMARQRYAEITVDGILGPQSWAALDAQNAEGLR